LLRTSLIYILGLFFVANLPVWAAKKEIVRLQADVMILQQHVRGLQKSFDSEIAVLKALVERLYDQSNKVQLALEHVKNFNQQTQASVGSKVESMDTQFSVVNTGIDMVMDRINKLSIQLAETKTQVESLDGPWGTGTNGSTGWTSGHSYSDIYNNRGEFFWELSGGNNEAEPEMHMAGNFVDVGGNPFYCNCVNPWTTSGGSCPDSGVRSPSWIAPEL